MSTEALFETVPADSVQGPWWLIDVHILPHELHGLVEKWLNTQKWDDRIPNFTAQVLVNEATLIYLPFWAISGQGIANWSAEVRTRYGYETRRGTEAISLSNEPLSNYVVSGILNKVVGKRNWRAKRRRITQEEAHQIPILPPQHEAITRQELDEFFDAALKRMVQRKWLIGAYGRPDMQINKQKIGLSAETWLYPLYVSYFLQEGEYLSIQIDGVNGSIYSDLPASERRRRTNEWTLIAILAMATFAVLTILLVLLILRN